LKKFMLADAAHAPPAVECRALAKTFTGGRGDVPAVAPLTLTFEAGRTTALVGPSGCGKSTLLRMIAGLEAPSAGEVRIDGMPPAEVRRRAGLAIGFQDPSLLPWRSVRGNVALALRLARMPGDRAAVDDLIALVGLAGFEDRRPAELSGGMRQRAAIARCLITRPGLLLLDEPFGAVDELTRRRLAEDLPKLWESRGTTTLLVTHSIAEAVLLADRVIVFTPRPAAVAADVAVPLERPRPAQVQASAAFRDIEDSIADALGATSPDHGERLAAQ
jgi:NitT/TauT family transport system ATP-binding protein